MATDQAAAAGRPEPRHWLRILLIWLVAAAIADPLIWFLLGPHMPPGAMSSAAASQQFDINVMAVMAAPVMLFVLSTSATPWWSGGIARGTRRTARRFTATPAFRSPGSRRPPSSCSACSCSAQSNCGCPPGAGAGEGAAPIWKPTGDNELQVQVIAQQWIFTYRYPQFGGMETTQLVLPQGRNVQFNVTSLDVIHSFWAYQLGVKADANPGVSNVAFTKPQHLGGFQVHCAELCGIFHGAMTNVGQVETPAQFESWATATETQLADVTKILPPYATVYDPTVIPNIGKALQKLGIIGANGSYYPPQDPAQP